MDENRQRRHSDDLTCQEGCKIRNSIGKDYNRLDNDLLSVRAEMGTMNERLDRGARKIQVLFWMGVVTIILGLAKIVIELSEVIR